MNKPTLKERLIYWFDNRMAKGSIGLINFLIYITITVVMLLCGLIILLGFNEETSPGGVFWDGFSTIVNAWMPSFEDGSPGYVLIMAVIAICGVLITSVLIGIFTSAMEEKIMSLRRGNSIVIENDHIVVLGFYEGEYTLIRQLILAAVKKPCTIVIGAEMERDELEQLIADNIEVPKNIRLICRTVDVFNPASLEKLSLDTCRTILISPTDDYRTIKTLLAVSALVHNTVNNRVRVNAIISREERRFPASLAKKHNITTLQTNDTLAKIIAHSSTQTGLSEVFKEIFNFEGNELYVIKREGIGGLKFVDLLSRMDKALPIGIYRNHEITMNPDADMVLEDSDRILVFAETRESAVLRDHGEVIEVGLDPSKVIPDRETKIMIFGNNDSLITVLREVPEVVTLAEIVNYKGEKKKEIEAVCAKRNMRVEFITGNTRTEMGLLEICRNAEHIVILSTQEDRDKADMFTIFLLLNLRDLRSRYHLRYNITAEMQSEMNQSLVVSDDYIDYVVASNMSSLFLAQLAESPELASAFRELLSNRGNELYLKRAENLCIEGEYTVNELRQIVYAQGYVFLGYMTGISEYVFNPGLDQVVKLRGYDHLIVLGES